MPAVVATGCLAAGREPAAGTTATMIILAMSFGLIIPKLIIDYFNRPRWLWFCKHMVARSVRKHGGTLVAAIARGRHWLDELTTDASISSDSIAKREGCSVRKVNMTISLAFLAPDIVKAAIVDVFPSLPAALDCRGTICVLCSARPRNRRLDVLAPSQPCRTISAFGIEISVCVRLRGGAGRTRTSNQSVMRNLFFDHGSCGLSPRMLPNQVPS
jgi:hypothetical protein